MTTKTLTGAYPTGYSLASGVTQLIVSQTANVGGTGVSAAYAATISNYGTIQASAYYGVNLRAGGSVINGSISDRTALISGSRYGVAARYGGASLTNNATIVGGSAGVDLHAGGTVVNGGTNDLAASISGGKYGVESRYASAIVNNRAAIQGATAGVALNAGGKLNNGLTTDTTAMVTGGTYAVEARFGALFVNNLGTIETTGYDAVVTMAGGSITNGSTASASALIYGKNDAIYAMNHSVSVTNFASIAGAGFAGVQLAAGGAVNNGSATLTSASISGYFNGVYANDRSAAVNNFGTITGSRSEGVHLAAGGAVTNGSGTSTNALIQGYSDGVYSNGRVLNVANFGTVTGTTDNGVLLTAGGYVANGGTATSQSLISGYLNGVYATLRAATVVNFGTIEGVTAAGVSLQAGGAANNGNATLRNDLIKGYVGVYASAFGAATVTNFGTIDGTNGVSVQLAAATDRLIAESGSSWIGSVQGGGGALELATGSGAITGLGSSGTVSGAEAMTFSGFGSYYFDAGTTWTLTGANSVSSATQLTVYGSLINEGVLTAGAGLYVGQAGVTITNYGSIHGGASGSLIFGVAGDRLVAEAGSSIVGVVVGGGATLELASGAGTISGLGFAATLSGSDAMTVGGFGSYLMDTGTSWTLTGTDSVSSGLSVLVGGTLTCSGVVSVAGLIGGAGTLAISSGTLAINSGATLTVSNWSAGGGTTGINQSLAYKGAFSEGGAAVVTVGAGDRLSLSGTTALGGTLNGAGTATVVNATVSGLTVGGGLALAASGAITQTGGLIIGDATGTGASVSILSGGVWNLGGHGVALGASGGKLLDYGLLIQNAGTGVSKVAVGVVDKGVIEAAVATLDLTVAVTGTGAMKIDAGATLEVDAGAVSTLTTTFNGANATLALKSPTAFAATIGGLAVSDTIDLLGQTATGASVNGSDQLVIVNGAKTVATLQLSGAYASATFKIGSDGAGGTDVTLLTAAAVPPSGGSTQAFAAAMAGWSMAPATLTASSSHAEAWKPLFAAPSARFI